MKSFLFLTLLLFITLKKSVRLNSYIILLRIQSVKAFTLLLNTYLNADKKLVKLAFETFFKAYYKIISTV